MMEAKHGNAKPWNGYGINLVSLWKLREIKRQQAKKKYKDEIDKPHRRVCDLEAQINDWWVWYWRFQRSVQIQSGAGEQQHHHRQ